MSASASDTNPGSIPAREPLVTSRAGSRTLVGLVIASVVLLGATLLLAVTLLEQSRRLDENVAISSGIINANVRTIGQVQRELLRTAAAIESQPIDPADLELKRSFASQRMREVALSYQLQTLGTERLLDIARAQSERWFDEVEPAIASIVAGGRSPELLTDTLNSIGEIEFEFNDLGSKGEINRKQQAGRANDATVAMLGTTRRLALGLGATFLGFLAVVVTFVRGFRRFDRQREASNRRLVTMNKELLTLSEVASRTGNLVVITDADGRIEWVNDAFGTRTGYTLDDVLGRRPGDVLQGPATDPEAVRMMSERLRARQGFTTEIVNYSRHDVPYWVRIEVRPVHDDTGVVTNFIGVQTDVTEEHETQEYLRRAKEAAEQVAEQKAQFLASMSHEIRTPLNAVIGLTDLLLETDLDDQQREFVTTAHTSGALLLSTINNILSFSAVEAGRVELECRAFDIRTLVHQTVEMLDRQAADKGLELHVSIDDSIPATVRGDETRLQQVLVNMLGNAVKFTERGSVGLTVRRRHMDATIAHIEFVVEDTGIGIAADRLPWLFEPFTQADASTTRRYGGSGLGLAIARQILGLMGGTIDVTSEEGTGTTFTVEIGLETDLVTDRTIDRDDHVQTKSPPPDDRSMHILVAEDDKVNQMVITHMLLKLGHHVELATDGVEAVAAVHRCRFDLVLMDVQMPRLDGVGAARRIRAELSEGDCPRIVALTANALDGDRERLLAAGMDDYLSKPVRLDDLRQMLHRTSDRSPLRSSRRWAAASSCPAGPGRASP